MKPAPARMRTLDVRPLIAAGQNPFEAITTALAALAAGESLLLLTPFLPSPLIERVRGEGFAAQPERRGDGTWQTRFSRS
jgi:uncharacterized protein (DUF2249 family)